MNLINLVNTRKWKKDFLGIDITPIPPQKRDIILGDFSPENLILDIPNLKIFENDSFLNFLKINYIYGFFNVEEVEI